MKVRGERREELEAERKRSASESARRARAKRKGRTRSEGRVSGDDSWRVPPVPIPNTEVKPPRADGTRLGTAWESRTLPGSKARERGKRKFFPLPSIEEKGGRAREAEPKRESGGEAEAPGGRNRPGRRTAGRCGKRKRRAKGAEAMILSSSMAEHSAVNRRVVSSSLT